MKYRQLGKSGLRVSVVGLGTMVHAGHFGPVDDTESLRAIDKALELGVNFVDTSDAYGAGYAETILGRALKGRRDKVIIATKGGNTMVGPRRGTRDFSVPYISRVLDESLERLQTDYVDLYQLHNPTVEVIEHGDVWELLERRKQEGKIRHYGVSINKMEEGIAAVKGGRSETIQIEYNLLSQQPADDVLPQCRAANVGVIARVPLKRGLLSGKMTVSDVDRFQGDDIRARQFTREVLERELAKVEHLRFLVHDPFRTLAQVAIAFCIADPSVGTVIPGARNAAQMEENAKAADWSLPEAELAKIKELWKSNFSGDR
jgi:aryl-alcohol dehydrogenase-like predicted oxidoreductase